MKEARGAELLSGVLKDVSRSFYLSLRLLPRPMRRGAGVGYLLARASDTIADTRGVAVERRIESLEKFEEAVAGDGVWRADGEVMGNCRAGERVLIERMAEVFQCYVSLPEGERELVREVVRVILSGQKLDLLRSCGAAGMTLANDDELWDYCDRVAGCVGVFWTKLGYLTMGEAFSRESPEVMCAAGRSLGRGLQLVNLLRDLPEDVSHGRHYFPMTDGVAVEELMGEVHRWIRHAKDCVEDGKIYAKKIRDRRARAASVLPALLAEDTLLLLERASWEELQRRVKVGRGRVFRRLVEALFYR